MTVALAILDLFSILVYLDLALVNRYKVHLFNPLFAKSKQAQQAY